MDKSPVPARRQLQPMFANGRVRGLKERRDAPDALPSERVALSSPMSFSGSLQRIWRLAEIPTSNPWARAGLVASASILVLVAFTLIACWYMFAIVLWPFLLISRLAGRHQRKEDADRLRHREMLDAIRDGRTS